VAHQCKLGAPRPTTTTLSISNDISVRVRIFVNSFQLFILIGEFDLTGFAAVGRCCLLPEIALATAAGNNRFKTFGLKRADGATSIPNA